MNLKIKNYGAMFPKTHICRLENGDFAYYDAVGTRYNYDRDVFEYIGDGVIWEIDGVLQNSTRIQSFYVRRSE